MTKYAHFRIGLIPYEILVNNRMSVFKGRNFSDLRPILLEVICFYFREYRYNESFLEIILTYTEFKLNLDDIGTVISFTMRENNVKKG